MLCHTFTIFPGAAYPEGEGEVGERCRPDGCGAMGGDIPGGKHLFIEYSLTTYSTQVYHTKGILHTAKTTADEFAG